MSLSALLTAQAIPVIEWNSTTIDNALVQGEVQGDNMYLNVFNNDLIFPRKGFLSLDNLPTVVKGCLLSTGFALVCVDRFIKVLRFSMSIFALFPVYMSTCLCNYGVMFFYVVKFNPDVSMYIQS